MARNPPLQYSKQVKNGCSTQSLILNYFTFQKDKNVWKFGEIIEKKTVVPFLSYLLDVVTLSDYIK